LKPMCSPTNIDLCDDAKKAEIVALQALPEAELTAKIDDAEATVNSLTEDIKDANEMIAKIVAFMNEATEIRKIGKKENALAIKDSQDAQTAVTNAITIKQIVEAEAEPVEIVAEAETIAEAVVEGSSSTVEPVAIDKDTHGHDDCCGGNKVNVDIVFKVNMGGESVGTEEAGDLASTAEETPTSD